MQSVDEFTPSTTEPVFGSGLVSQNKSQALTNNDVSDNEKVIPPTEPIVNGQNEAAVSKLTLNENITNGTNENTAVADSSAVHVNGQNGEPTVETNNEVQSVSANENSIVPSIESTSVDTVNEVSSTAMDTAPVVEEPTTTTTESVNANAAAVPVATESETTEVKSKSPRGKAKAPVAAITPTRQSARGRKPASSSNVDETASTDESIASSQNESSSSSSQRTKRQAATLAKDAITASNQANSTDDVNEQNVVPSVGSGDTDITEGQVNASPSPGKKRGAPKSTPTAAKKTKGQTFLTPTDDVNDEVAATTTEGEIVQTPPKKARTSAPKKTPEPPIDEYARKLRPRK